MRSVVGGEVLSESYQSLGLLGASVQKPGSATCLSASGALSLAPANNSSGKRGTGLQGMFHEVVSKKLSSNTLSH